VPRRVIREDRYQCPECTHWYGEHMNTRALARHKEPGGDPYTLCHGSLTPLHGLPHQKGGNLAPPLDGPVQDGLFPITGELLG
jgi:hypothetical protein